MPQIMSEILKAIAVTLISVVSTILVAEINERMTGRGPYSSFDDLP